MWELLCILLFIIIITVAVLLWLQPDEETTDVTQGGRDVNRPYTVHVMGYPGSGKSWLGKEIATRFGNDITVIDMDVILDPVGEAIVEELHRAKNIHTQDDYDNFRNDLGKKFIERFREQVRKAIYVSSKPVLLVGITYYNIGGGLPYVASISDLCDMKYYINIPVKQLVEQHWNRDVHPLVCELCRRGPFAQQLIKGNKNLSLDINYRNMKKWTEHLKKQYPGYHHFNQKTLVEYITKLFKNILMLQSSSR
jgi:hypothetical protein